MARFRKKPVVVEAVQFRPSDPHMPIVDWLDKAVDDGTVEWVGSICRIKTMEGTMVANVGDWIIQGVKGELYPCKPDIFAATYEAV